MARMDTKTNTETTPTPAQANEKMERREAMGDRSRTVVMEPDAVSANRVAGPVVAGIVGGGIVGALAGLLLSLIPGLGISIWIGLVVGLFLGIVLGGFVAARLALNTADGGASGTYRFPRSGNNELR